MTDRADVLKRVTKFRNYCRESGGWVCCSVFLSYLRPRPCKISAVSALLSPSSPSSCRSQRLQASTYVVAKSTTFMRVHGVWSLFSSLSVGQ